MADWHEYHQARSLMRTIAITLSLLFAGCAAVHSRDDGVVAVVVNGIESMNASISSKPNQMPWEIEKIEKGTFMFSNSCGFGHATYRTCPNGDSRACFGRMTIHFLRGEWCEVREFVFERPTLLLVRRWKGKNFLVGNAETAMDADEHRYIISRSFLAEWNLQALATNLSKSDVCVPIDLLTPDELERLKSDSDSAISSRHLCFQTGVRLEDTLKHFSSQPSNELK